MAKKPQKRTLDDITKAAFDNLIGAVERIEPELARTLLDYIAQMDTQGGEILNNAYNTQLAELIEGQVAELLNRVGFVDDIVQYLTVFDEATDYLKAQQADMNRIKLDNAFLNPIKAASIEGVISDMAGLGLSQIVIKPVRDILTRAILGGGFLGDVQKELKGLILTDPQRAGILKKHYIQISRDAVGQYVGRANNAIQTKYKLDGYRYVGSLIEDSRPQCIRWHDKREIAVTELEAEIKWAENNGSGLIPGTTPSNWPELRGGYNCRHEAIPIRLKKD